jgi:hypothetical protein
VTIFKVEPEPETDGGCLPETMLALSGVEAPSKP